MGAIKLPIPIFSNGKEYREVSLKPLQAGVIADTNRVVEKGDTYKAMQTFIAGCVESIGDITDKVAITALIGQMSYQSAHFVAVKIVFHDEKDDGVEGYYKCPRCGEPKVCEYNENPDLDTRDFLSDLPVKFLGEGKDFSVELDNPIEIKNADEGMDIVMKLRARYPTLNDCSMAFSRVGEKDKVRLQFQIYIQSLVAVNDIEVDNKYRNNFGMFVFDHMDRKDIKKFADACEEYGIKTEIAKVCNKCQKDFKVQVNTSNFFVSSLQ